MRPKVAVGYSFLNDEKAIPSSLDPWYPNVDHIIAIDGRYKTPAPPNSPMIPDYSTDNSEQILKDRYEDKLVYEKLCDTQINKRQRYLDIAGKLNCDILITFDSDDYLYPDPDFQDWQIFNRELEILAQNPEPSYHYMWAWLPSDELWPKQNNAVPSNSWQSYARIHNKPGEQCYILNHYTFTTKKKLAEHGIDKIGYHYMTHRKEPSEYILWADPYEAVEGIRFTTDRIHRTDIQLDHGNIWTWQNAREEEIGLVNCWRRYCNMEPIPLERPHYYDKNQKLIFL
jgi:hypothetical protein